jgi:hypothetical protein
MKFFKGLTLIFVGVAWGRFWVCSLTLIVNNPSYSDMRALQTLCYFVMVMAVAPLGFGPRLIVGHWVTLAPFVITANWKLAFEVIGMTSLLRDNRAA